MKEKIAIIDEVHGFDNHIEREFKRIEIDKEVIEILGDSFTGVSQAMSDLAKAIQKDVEEYDYLTTKKLKEQSFKDGVGNLKHIKKRGGR